MQVREGGRGWGARPSGEKGERGLPHSQAAHPTSASRLIKEERMFHVVFEVLGFIVARVSGA